MTTEAGRDLLAAFPRIAELEYGRNGLPIVAAIEAEAIAAERARVRAAVEGLIPRDRWGPPGEDEVIVLDRGAVLDLLDPVS